MSEQDVEIGLQFETDVTLNEMLVKTSYFVQSNKSDDKIFQGEPEAYGTGFMVLWKENVFFVTADHIAHVKDHDLKMRTGEDNVVGVHTYIRHDLTSCVILLSNSFYAERYNVKTDEFERMDVCVTKLTREQTNIPFFTPEVIIPERKIQKGERMLIITEENFAEPNVDDTYYVCGHIHPKIKNGIYIEYQKAFKGGLKFKLQNGDNLLFNTEDVIVDDEEWRGVSGAPIINQDGKCVGIVTSVNEGSKMVWGCSVATIKLIIEMSLRTKKQDLSQNGTISIK